MTTNSTLSVCAMLDTPALPSSTTRRQTATATGKAPPLKIIDLGPAGPLGHPPDEVQPRRDRFRPPPRPLHLPTRQSAQCHYRPTTTTQSLWEISFYGSRLTPGETPTANTRSDALGKAAKMLLADFAEDYSHADWRREQHAESTCHAMMRYISIVRPLVLLPDVLPCYPSQKRPCSSDIRCWGVRVDYIQPSTTSFYSSVTRQCRLQRLTNPTLFSELFASSTTSRFATTSPCLCALASCKLVIRRPLATLVPRVCCACWNAIMVDRHECVNPVVASPMLEVPSTEKRTVDCPLTNHLNSSSGRSRCRCQ